MSKNKYGAVVIVGILVFLTINSAYGYEDNFGQAEKIEGNHFVVYYAPQLDVLSLIQQLNIEPSEEILSHNPSSGGFSNEDKLSNILDTLFLRICEILDMNLFSFKGNIKICRNHEHLSSIFKGLFDKDLKSSALYIYTYNTIYISPESFKTEILGHEIAHAIISNYFVVQPPEKIAEILSGYVEYQLRKTEKK